MKVATTSLALIFLLSVPSFADGLKIPADMTSSFQSALLRLSFASACNKRLDRPATFEKATMALERLFQKANIDNAHALAEKAAQALQSVPEEKKTPNAFSIFNETNCANLDDSLTKELHMSPK